MGDRTKESIAGLSAGDWWYVTELVVTCRESGQLIKTLQPAGLVNCDGEGILNNPPGTAQTFQK